MHRLCLLISLVLCVFSASAAESTPDQSSPQSVINSFFGALKADDDKILARLLAPHRKDMTSDPKFWEYWKGLWNKCEIASFVGTLESRRSKFEETVFVPVEYKCSHRPNFQKKITVSRIGKKWYWDEN
jgi:hypothetical protein